MPEILGGAFDILSLAMAIRPKVSLASRPRMADFAEWGYAIAEAAGWGGEDFFRAYENNINRQHEEALSVSVVAQTVLEFMKSREKWQGQASELKPLFDEEASTLGIDTRVRGSGWPRDPARLSKELRGLAETLPFADIEVSFPSIGHQRSILLRKVVKSTVGSVGTVGSATKSTDGAGKDTVGENEDTVGQEAHRNGATDGTDGKNQQFSDDVLRI